MRAQRTLYSLILLSFVFILSCKKNNNDIEAEPGKVLTIDMLYQNVELPGEVSIFFQVYDKKNDVPIAGLNASDFIIGEKGPNDDKFNSISQSESSATIDPDNQNFVFSTILVLDLSGSVMSDLPNLKTSAQTFINTFMPEEPTDNTKMGIWWFDGEEELHELQDFSDDKEVLLAAIESISDTISVDNSTNLYGAVIQAGSIASDNATYYDELEILNSTSVVIFTDGTDQAAFESKEDAFSTASESSANIRFLTIGLGSEIDEAVLESIGLNGSAFAEDPSKLNETFSKIAQRISDQAKSYYLFKYCSPKRNGNNIGLEIRINTTINGKKHIGSAETSFDATDFTGC